MRYPIANLGQEGITDALKAAQASAQTFGIDSQIAQTQRQVDQANEDLAGAEAYFNALESGGATDDELREAGGTVNDLTNVRDQLLVRLNGLKAKRAYFDRVAQPGTTQAQANDLYKKLVEQYPDQADWKVPPRMPAPPDFTPKPPAPIATMSPTPTTPFMPVAPPPSSSQAAPVASTDCPPYAPRDAQGNCLRTRGLPGIPGGLPSGAVPFAMGIGRRALG